MSVRIGADGPAPDAWAAEAPNDPRPDAATGRVSMVPAPRAGWTSVLLVLVMLLATGIALDDLRWATLPSGASATSWLPWLMVAAGMTGTALAMSPLGQGRVDLVAAAVGTAVGLAVVAGTISDAPDLATRLRDLNLSMTTALSDILVARARTTELSPFLLTLSALAWTTGAFAAIGVVRRAHAPSAWVPIGLLLLIPMLLAERTGGPAAQLLWLVVVAGAGLLLALRLNLERQRRRWVRHHVLGGRGVGSLFLRGGSVMVVLALSVAVALTAVAGTAPLSAAWQRLGEALDDVGLSMGGLVGAPEGPVSGVYIDLPRSQRVADRWQPGEGPAFTAHVDDDRGHYWRLGIYDRLEGDRLSQTGSVETHVASGEDLIGGSPDLAAYDLPMLDLTARITLADEGASVLPAPRSPLSLDRDARLVTMGAEGPFQHLGAAVAPGPRETYEVEALEIDTSAGGVTIHQLAVADDAPDPAWVDPYLQLASEDLGRETRAWANRIARSVGDGPSPRYRTAQAIQDALRRDGIYQTDLRGVCGPTESIADCVIRTDRGFCVQFAWTMVLTLRHLDIPARYVQGYLPGTSIAPGEWEVARSAAHAWVEVYFPGIGWLPFDPTPSDAAGDLAGSGQVVTDLAQGEPIEPAPTADPSASEPSSTDEPLPTDDPIAEAVTPEPSMTPTAVSDPGAGASPPPGPIIVALIVGGGVALGGLMLLLWLWRLPGGRTDRAWEGVVSLATRLGRPPRPSQTPYEYSDSLSRVVPRAAHELRTVADARVDAAYGRRLTDETDAGVVRHAYARARVGLLALLLRRR